MSVNSVANGVYQDCGYGRSFSLKVSCDGPSCGAITGFPGLTCTQKASTTECDNGVTCNIASSEALAATTVVSNFTVQQRAQTADVQSTQNLNINGQQFNVMDMGNGNVSYTHGNEEVTPSGTTTVAAPSPTSKAPPRLSVSNWMFIILTTLSMFIAQIQAQSSPWADVLIGFPSDIINLVQSNGDQLCQQMLPTLNSVINQGQADYRGVADLNLVCMQVLGQATAANTDPSAAFYLTLGKTLACDKIANDMLFGSSAQVGRVLCQVNIVSASTGGSTLSILASTATSTLSLSLPPVPPATTISPTSAGSSAASGASVTATASVPPVTASEASPSQTASSAAPTGNGTIAVAERWKRGRLPVRYPECFN